MAFPAGCSPHKSAAGPTHRFPLILVIAVISNRGAIVKRTLTVFVPEAGEVDLAREAAVNVRSVLEASDGPHHKTVSLAIDGSADILIPPSALSLLVGVLDSLAEGEGVTLVPHESELTTQQAADLLNVSRPYLVSLLENGDISFRVVGSHRRVHASSLLAYKRKDDLVRKSAINALAALSEEIGLT